MVREAQPDKDRPAKRDENKKKPYSSPVLSRYGLLKELTAGGSGATQEMGMMDMDMVMFP
jgi:hypothetical protein